MHSLRYASTRLSLLGTGTAIAIGLASCATPFAPDATASAPRLEGYGTLGMSVVTASPEAAELFRRGMLQSYAFNDEEAARAFKAALAKDPSCAMCAWGVAKAAGPNINNPERGELAEARRHLAWAMARVSPAAPRERALIEALIERYGEAPSSTKVDVTAGAICSSGGAAEANPLDVVYAARMRALADAYPDDPDVLTLYAEAAMIATADDWWDKKTGQPGGEIGAVTDRLERALAAHPNHTGLNHFMIHAADSSPRPERALAASDRLGALAPASPHLLHMPAHIYVRTARYADASRVNEEAVVAQAKLYATLDAGSYARSTDWDRHNRHFLWFAALTEGRGELALAQAREMAGRAARGKSATAEFFRSLPLITLVRLERWSDVMAEPVAEGEAGVAPALTEFALGLALLRTGRLDDARARSAALQLALDAPVLKGATLMGDDPVRTMLEVFAGRLTAEIAGAEGRPADALAALTRAAELENGLHANEPPILGSASRVALGEVMLRARRGSDAEAAYRAELVAQPGSGWALSGLARALEQQGRADEARGVRVESERAWPRADASLRTVALR